MVIMIIRMNSQIRSVLNSFGMALVLVPLTPLTASAGMVDTNGMAPWEVCALCHSADGVSVMSKFPKLAGQKAAYIEKQFWDFHFGKRDNDGGQMQAITTEVAVDDVKAIAAYFSHLPVPIATTPPENPDCQQYDQGARLFLSGRRGVVACSECHMSESSLAPYLKGQHQSYLKKQLLNFKSARRKNDPEKIMQSVAEKLTENEIESVSFYLEFFNFDCTK